MQMRRADRAITDPDHIDIILARADVGHLGLTDAEGVYVVPLSFAHATSGDGRVTVYVHGAQAGRKVAAITEAPGARICFEAEIRHATFGADDLQACHIGVAYESVIGWGTARVVTDPGEARSALSMIVEKYAPGRGGDVPEALEFVAVLAFDLDTMTGKRRTAPTGPVSTA
ncbi:MAG: pyridoxamine 5'-phosphate oxidase family protein [Propionibacteriaceae bacterium]|nr:pyridoxamine 5'-phosphate oxidase family protein [Propionibacteriaceae bacterium]